MTTLTKNLHSILVLATVASLSLAAPGCLHWPGPTSSPKVLELFGGAEGYELVHLPALARVERYRLAADPASAPATAAGGQRIGGIAVAAGPSSLDGPTLAELAQILRSADTYDWAAPAPANASPPTVALRFMGARKTIDLAFSFPDNVLSVYESQRLVGRASFAPRAKDLARLLTPR